MESPGSSQIDGGRLPLLDGLRGIAAIFVMLYHVEVTFGPLGSFSRSYLFVDFFFLLSGFVLTLSAERKMNAGLGAVAFLRARVVRLWPVIAIAVGAGALLALAEGDTASLTWLVALALVMIPAMDRDGLIFPLNGPQWSLLLELMANLVHAVLLRRLSDRWLLVLAAISAIALAATIAHFGSNTLGPFSFNWWFAFPRVAFSYTLGVYLGRRWAAGVHKPLASPRIALALPPLLLVSLPALPLSVAWGDMLMVIALFPVLLWLAVTCDTPRRWRAALGALGAVSYPLYAIHTPVLEAFAPLGASWPVKVLAAGCALFAAWAIARMLAALPRGRRARYSPQTAQAQ